MNVDELVATFASISDRASLIAFLAPLRLPPNLSEQEKARVTVALLTAASRCWRGGGFGRRRGGARRRHPRPGGGDSHDQGRTPADRPHPLRVRRKPHRAPT